MACGMTDGRITENRKAESVSRLGGKYKLLISQKQKGRSCEKERPFFDIAFRSNPMFSLCKRQFVKNGCNRSTCTGRCNADWRYHLPNGLVGSGWRDGDWSSIDALQTL